MTRTIIDATIQAIGFLPNDIIRIIIDYRGRSFKDFVSKALKFNHKLRIERTLFLQNIAHLKLLIATVDHLSNDLDITAPHFIKWQIMNTHLMENFPNDITIAGYTIAANSPDFFVSGRLHLALKNFKRFNKQCNAMNTIADTMQAWEGCPYEYEQEILVVKDILRTNGQARTYHKELVNKFVEHHLCLDELPKILHNKHNKMWGILSNSITRQQRKGTPISEEIISPDSAELQCFKLY